MSVASGGILKGLDLALGGLASFNFFLLNCFLLLSAHMFRVLAQSTHM